MGTQLDSIIASPQPMAEIFLNSFGQKGALAIWAIIVIVQYMMGSSMVSFCLDVHRIGLLNNFRFSQHLVNSSLFREMALCHSLAGFTA
jgi:hypothetical protein